MIDADVAAALDELMSETAALTRVMPGAGGECATPPASAWLGRFTEWDGGAPPGGMMVVVEPD